MSASWKELKRQRPRRPLVTGSILFLGGLCAAPWIRGTLAADPLWTDRTATNLQRFLTEIRPYPLQGRPWDPEIYAAWLAGTFGDTWLPALGSTLALSVAAVLVAAVLGGLLAPLAARNLARPRPFESRRPTGAAAVGWRLVRTGTNAVLIFGRAVPEYVWAFLFLSMLGVGPWPAVLALGIHNAGILGRLNAEVIENMEPSAPRALAGLGAGRGAIAVLAALPRNLGRLLLYFFYRWETCVREATVLGLLGFTSIGWYIQDARAGVRYDEMVHYVALGAGLVLLGDVVSGAVRRAVRRA
ncbi:MAG: ABC transporter permease subunit [Gemmatimonadetes bacterium]|nr:ABC transporter permease subunit [Gemmatimonadota bacterium]